MTLFELASVVCTLIQGLNLLRFLVLSGGGSAEEEGCGHGGRSRGGRAGDGVQGEGCQYLSVCVSVCECACLCASYIDTNRESYCGFKGDFLFPQGKITVKHAVLSDMSPGGKSLWKHRSVPLM